MKKYNYVYKVTCLVPESEFFNHYYIGQHSTDNLDNNYCGSGKLIKEYIKKYGNIKDVTYSKEILAFAENYDDLDNLEYEIIGDLYKTDNLCLNILPGGNSHKGEKGGMYGKKHSDETKIKMSESQKKVYEDPKQRERISKIHKGKTLTEETKQKISEKNKGNIPVNKGVPLTEEQRKHLSITFTGRIWINNGIEQHQIKPEDISKYQGFERGMLKMNTIWINNGIEHHLIKEENISKYPGFVRGKLKKKRG